ncbi:MAG: hypothetical protein K0Q79_738 [Flavipsychrobacter sp.]|jgi:hypothetical protein|nr:hypothetical protein [Flavipsychrobacter sp.]
MRKIFTTLLLIASGYSGFSQVTWGTPVTVYTGSGANLRPRVAVNRNGDPYVLWGMNNTRAYFSKWNGTSFTTPVIASGTLVTAAQDWMGPEMAAFGDTVYVAVKATPELTTPAYLVHSYDGGATFATPVRVDYIGSDISRFPTVTPNATGDPIVAFMKFDSGSMAMNTGRYVVARSSDGGMTFSSDVLASSPSNDVCDCCPASIISSGSKVIMLYRDNASNIREMWAGISTDGGITFPTRMAVDSTNWMLSSCPSSGPDGFVIGDSLYTVFMSSASGKALVYLSRSSLSMGNMSHVRITGNFTGLNSQNFPRIANSNNTSAVVWVQNTTPAAVNVAYSFTADIASGFSGYTNIPGATSSGIRNADVAMSPGAIHVVWQDNTGNKVMYVKGTYSTVGITNVAKEVIDVYPNPAGDNFTVSLKNVGKIGYCYLSDVTGRQIDITPVVGNERATFSVKGIAKGNYYFVLVDETGKQYSSKLILQ